MISREPSLAADSRERRHQDVASPFLVRPNQRAARMFGGAFQHARRGKEPRKMALRDAAAVSHASIHVSQGDSGRDRLVEVLMGLAKPSLKEVGASKGGEGPEPFLTQ